MPCPAQAGLRASGLRSRPSLRRPLPYEADQADVDAGPRRLSSPEAGAVRLQLGDADSVLLGGLAVDPAPFGVLLSGQRHPGLQVAELPSERIRRLLPGRRHRPEVGPPLAGPDAVNVLPS